MPSPRPPFAKVVALKSLEWAIRFWPRESRPWGQALLAETHEIPHPLEALFWALGGVTVFLRSHLAHLLALLKLPPGRTTAPLPVAPGNNGPRFPHNSRLVTALILLAVTTLLLVPPGRQATSIVSSSWSEFQATPGEVRVVERLATEAEKKSDAHQLAFLANCEPDPTRGEQYAARAVELDPGLVWVFASRFRRPDMTINKEWLLRLQHSDPDNAFVHILAAEAAVDPNVWSRFGPNGPDATQASEIPGYSEWTANMERAFRSARYDSYAQRHLDLTSEGWRTAPQVPLSLVVYSFWSHFLPDLSQIERFADEKIAQAQKAAAAGHPQEAEQSLRQFASFGQQMVAESETDFERLGALAIARRGQDALRKFYAQSGRQADEQAVVAQLRQLEISKENLMQGGMRSRGESWNYFRRRAILVQISACSTVVLAALTVLGLILLEIRVIPLDRLRILRWSACRVADFGPATVLALASVFLLSFRPFALAVEQYRSGIPANAATPELIWQLMALGFMQPFLYLFQPSGHAALWLLLTIALSLVAVAVVVRGIWRHAAPTQRA
jgi:hypothetical protein